MIMTDGLDRGCQIACEALNQELCLSVQEKARTRTIEVHAVGRFKDGGYCIYGFQTHSTDAGRTARWCTIRLDLTREFRLSVFNSQAPRPDFQLDRFRVKDVLLVARAQEASA